jgi:hypothetical protein
MIVFAADLRLNRRAGMKRKTENKKQIQQGRESNDQRRKRAQQQQDVPANF